MKVDSIMKQKELNIQQYLKKRVFEYKKESSPKNISESMIYCEIFSVKLSVKICGKRWLLGQKLTVGWDGDINKPQGSYDRCSICSVGERNAKREKGR